VRPLNHHGVNPAINQLSSRDKQLILKSEARLRSTGEWGPWEQVSQQEAQRTLRNLVGWVRDIRAAYRNRVFCVLERLDATGVIHAGIGSLSGIRPTWHEMQRIKDELFGADSTAVEVYPPRAEVVDGSDMYHLWILPGEIPFGLTKLEPSRQATTPAGELLMAKEKV
jgi:hypothetical protein